MTQATPASLKLVGERRHSHPSGSQKPGSNSVGGQGRGEGEGTLLSPLRHHMGKTATEQLLSKERQG